MPVQTYTTRVLDNQSLLWDNGDTALTTQIANPGKHYVRVSTPCFSYVDSFMVTLAGRPVALPDTTIRACAGDTITVGAMPQGGGPFLWRDERGLQRQTTRLGRFVFNDTGHATVYHKVFYTGTLGCTSTDSQTVAVTPRLPHTLPDSIFLCPNRDTLLDGATWYPQVTAFAWRLPDGTARTRGFNASAPGRYRLGFSYGGCPQRDSLALSSQAPPATPVIAYQAATPCADTVRVYKNPPSGGALRWANNGLPALNGQPAYALAGLRGHNYAGTLTTPCGSATSAVLTVPARPATCDSAPNVLPLEVFNLITPNGDGANDWFAVRYAPAATAWPLSIYSRWGARMYKGAYAERAWPAADVPPGAYFYRLVTDKQTFTGWVEVVR